MSTEFKIIEFNRGDYTITIYETKETQDIRRYPSGRVIATPATSRELRWMLYEGSKLIADGVWQTIHDAEALDKLMAQPLPPKEPELDRVPKYTEGLLGPFVRWLLRGGKDNEQA